MNNMKEIVLGNPWLKTRYPCILSMQLLLVSFPRQPVFDQGLPDKWNNLRRKPMENQVMAEPGYPYYCFKEDNWSTKLEGRYWNPSYGTQDLNICIVASVTRGIDWAAYIGAAPGAQTEEEALEVVSKWGAKLWEKDARYFFPEIKLPYRH